MSSGAGTRRTKQQEIAHSSCCHWRRLGDVLYSLCVVSVVNLRRLAKHFQNKVWEADGTDGTCEPQIVALPIAESVPRTE